MAKHRSYSLNDIDNWKFEDAKISSKWHDHLGEIPNRVIIYIDGHGGDGKTEYAIQMAKEFAMNGAKCRMINVELKKHKQIKMSFDRNRMKQDIQPNRNFQYDVITDFEAIKAKLKRPNSGKYIFIDSISYFPLNEKQIQELIEMFPNKNFIFLAYRVHLTKNQPIRHLCDLKINVSDHIAHNETGRFGGHKDYDVWPEKPRNKKTVVLSAQPTLFERKEAANG